MGAEPIIMLGVGATKCGTSWLHSYLASHPDCHFRSIKELHFFDALEKGKTDRELAHRQAEADAIRARLARGAAKAGAEERLRDREDWIGVLRAGEDTGAYVEYLKTGAGMRSIVGEVTPAYALLPVFVLQKMARMASDVRFVYVMRDPIARLWSHVRMIAGRRAGNGHVQTDRAGRILNRTFHGDEIEIEIRGDYRSALTKLGRAIDPSRLLVLVFEELVSGAAIGRLCDFLGIRRHAADLKPVHVGGHVPMSAEQERAAGTWLEPQYEFAATYLGRRPDSWRYDLVEVK